MSVDRKLLDSVAEKCKSIFAIVKPLDLVANVARAIEQEKSCQIIIMPLSEEDQRVAGCEGFTATCEPELKLGNTLLRSKDDPFRQHFVFFRPEHASELERFRVGHELGHCALHWPLTNSENRKIWGELGNIGKFYLVRFTRSEEEEADAFACLLGACQPKRVRRFRVDIDGAIEKVQEYMKQGFLQSPKFIK